jgi:phosphoglycerate dehydrogenase-like enzyme
LASDESVDPSEPFPDLEFAEAFNVELVEPHEVFRRADFLTLHTPLTKDTQSIVNETSLGLMQPGSFLVNTARGGLVDESALHSALEAGHIAGAALDVRTSEPPLPGDELEGHPRILPTPHMAGVSTESVERMAIAAANNLVEALRGDWDRDMVVNGVYPG